MALAAGRVPTERECRRLAVVGELGQQEEPPRCTSVSTDRLAVQRMHGSRPQVSAFRLEEEDQKPGKLFGGGFARRPDLSA
jgi:hypothetical protein